MVFRFFLVLVTSFATIDAAQRLHLEDGKSYECVEISFQDGRVRCEQADGTIITDSRDRVNRIDSMKRTKAQELHWGSHLIFLGGGVGVASGQIIDEEGQFIHDSTFLVAYDDGTFEKLSPGNLYLQAGLHYEYITESLIGGQATLKTASVTHHMSAGDGRNHRVVTFGGNLFTLRTLMAGPSYRIRFGGRNRIAWRFAGQLGYTMGQYRFKPAYRDALPSLQASNPGATYEDVADEFKSIDANGLTARLSSGMDIALSSRWFLGFGLHYTIYSLALATNPWPNIADTTALNTIDIYFHFGIMF